MFKTTAIDTLKQDKKCQACWYMILSTMSGSTTANDATIADAGHAPFVGKTALVYEKLRTFLMQDDAT